MIITALAISIALLPFVVHPYVVTGVSMEPTFKEGTLVLAEKVSHHFHVWRGEIIVTRNPHEKSVIEVKRVIGLPNELIEMNKDGVTVTDGKGKRVTYAPGTQIGGRQADSDMFRIQLGPEDYFVLGDNRSQSDDSRVFGAVQEADVLGAVILAL